MLLKNSFIAHWQRLSPFSVFAPNSHIYKTTLPSRNIGRVDIPSTSHGVVGTAVFATWALHASIAWVRLCFGSKSIPDSIVSTHIYFAKFTATHDCSSLQYPRLQKHGYLPPISIGITARFALHQRLCRLWKNLFYRVHSLGKPLGWWFAHLNQFFAVAWHVSIRLRGLQVIFTFPSHSSIPTIPWFSSTRTILIVGNDLPR